MHLSNDKSINQLAQDLLKQGWTLIKGRHGKLVPPCGRGRVIVPGTPGDHRAFLNFRRDVRRCQHGHAGRYQHDSHGVQS
jgi:hypothetical protein